MTRYLALRDKSGNWHRPDFSLFDSVTAVDRKAPADPVIEVHDLTLSDLREVAHAPDFLALAPSVATRLIDHEPMDELREDEAEPGWGLQAIGADKSVQTGAGIRLALLDTGIDHRHLSFEGLSLTTKDCTGSGIEDANGHGTHLAGTVFGRPVGEQRIGIAPGIEHVHIAKAIHDNGRGSSEAFFDALLWALRGGPHVLGFAVAFDSAAEIERLLAQGFPMTLASSAAQLAYRGNLRIFETLLRMKIGPRRPLVLGAVGDDSRRMIAPEFETGPAAPAAARGVVSVGALMRDENGLHPPSFSNAGPVVSAPGAGIVSARSGGGLRVMNGSAMAMAHALGAAALWAQKLRDEGRDPSAEAVGAALLGQASSEEMAPGLFSLNVGRGMVQAPSSTTV